jgi:hypothetical protein
MVHVDPKLDTSTPRLCAGTSYQGLRSRVDVHVDTKLRTSAANSESQDSRPLLKRAVIES